MMSLKPSALKSPAELTAKPVESPPSTPMKVAPGTLPAMAGSPIRLRLMKAELPTVMACPRRPVPPYTR